MERLVVSVSWALVVVALRLVRVVPVAELVLRVDPAMLVAQVQLAQQELLVQAQLAA